MYRTWFARTAVTVALTAAALALAAPGWAAAPAGTPFLGDPPGANGTVKIDGPEFDEGIDNEPHVSCDFAVRFFDFDQNEHANIVFAVQPPTGSDTVLLRRNGVLISQDPAGGGRPDPDEVLHFSVDDLGLSAYTPHPKQGYHVKLTVERIGAPGAGKHKVFWLRPCEAQTGPGPQGQGGGAGSGEPPVGTPGDGHDASLPVTGAAIGTMALAGVALVAGGAALVAVRRRRTRFVA
jgi:LPXTG-motif cell wall-anchored protein